MVKSWKIIVPQDKIQKSIHNTWSFFKPMDLIEMTDIHLLTEVLGKE